MSEDNAMPRPKMVAPDGSRVETSSAPQAAEPPQDTKRVAPPVRRPTEQGKTGQRKSIKLMQCQVCNGAISSGARFCPHCGDAPEPLVDQVRITDVHMPFWSMVGFMTKFGLAAIPAFILFVLIVAGLLSWMGIMGGALVR